MSWQELSKKYPFLTEAEFAKCLGQKSCLGLYPSRLLAVKSSKGLMFPQFQINRRTGKIYPVIPELIKLLQTINRSGKEPRSDADLIRWLLQPSPCLDNSRPINLLARPLELLNAAKSALYFEW